MPFQSLLGRILGGTLRLMSALLCAGLLALAFTAASRLEQTPTPDFELQERPRVILSEGARPPLSEGDELISVAGMPANGSETRLFLQSLPRSQPIQVVLERDGSSYTLALPPSLLLGCRFETGPEAATLVLTTPVGNLKAGTQILWVGEEPVDPDNAEELAGTLKKGDSLQLVVLQAGQITPVLLVTPKEQGPTATVSPKLPLYIAPSSTPLPSGLRPGDRVTHLDGVPAWNLAQATAQLSGISFRQTIRVGILRDEELLSIPVTIQTSLWDRAYAANLLLLAFCGIAFLIVLFLLFRHGDIWLSVSCAFLVSALFSSVALHWLQRFPDMPEPLFWHILQGLIPLSLSLAAPAAGVLLWNFPLPLRKPGRNPRFPLFLCLAWVLVFFLGTRLFPSAGIHAAFCLGGAAVVSVLGIVLSLRTYILTRKGPKGPVRFRLSIAWIVLGLPVPMAASVLLLSGRNVSWEMWLALLIFSGLHLPALLLYAHIRRRILYADVFFKNTLAYALVSAAILFLYMLVVVRAGSWLHRMLRVDSQWVLLGFLFFAAFLAEPLKKLALDLVGKLLYREEAGYREFLLSSSRKLNYLMETKEIAGLILGEACEVAHLEGGCLALRDAEAESYPVRAARGAALESTLGIHIGPDWELVAWIRQAGEPVPLSHIRYISRFEALPEAERSFLLSSRVEMVAPLLSRNELRGILLLSGKRSGDPFTWEDVAFLGGFCNQAAVALENAAIRENEKSVLRSLYEQKHLATLGQMSANIAHEIRNPLVAIKGLGKLVEESFDSSDKRRRHMEILNAEVSRLQNVVSELVRFSRPSPLQREETEIRELIGETLTLYAEEASRRGVSLSQEEGISPLILKVDPEKIKQVLVNLVQNSLDAQPEGGWILVRTSLSSSSMSEGAVADQVTIQIEDGGSGIPEEIREKIFEPFYTTRKAGTGLGLAIVRKIAEEHGGSIQALRGEKGGGCMELKLPLLVS